MIGTRIQCEKNLTNDMNKFTYVTNDMFRRDTYGHMHKFQ